MKCHRFNKDLSRGYAPSPELQRDLPRIISYVVYILAFQAGGRKTHFDFLYDSVRFWLRRVPGMPQALTDDDLSYVLLAAMQEGEVMAGSYNTFVLSGRRNVLDIVVGFGRSLPDPVGFLEEYRESDEYRTSSGRAAPVKPSKVQAFFEDMILRPDFRFIFGERLRYRHGGVSHGAACVQINLLGITEMRDPYAWLHDLDAAKLANMLQCFLPCLSIQMQDLEPWLRAGLERLDETTPRAQCDVLDGLILTGRLSEMRERLAALAGAAPLPGHLEARLAMAEFAEGEYGKAFDHLLAAVGRPGDGSAEARDLLRGLPEVVYLLAGLYRSGLPERTDFPKSIPYRDAPADFWGECLRPLEGILPSASSPGLHPLFSRPKSVSDVQGADWRYYCLPSFLKILAGCWAGTERTPLVAVRKYLSGFAERARATSNPIVVRLAEQLDNALSIGSHEDGDFFLHSPVEPHWLKYFRDYRPEKPREEEDEEETEAESSGPRSERLIWTLESPEKPFLRPVVQRLNPKGGWSRGRRLAGNSAHVIRMELAEGDALVTGDDRRLINILSRQFDPYISLKLFLDDELAAILKRMDRLYWEDDRQTPLPPVQEKKPCLVIQRESEALCSLTFHPLEDNPQFRQTFELDEHGGLAIFPMTETVRNLYRKFPRRMTIPLKSLPAILPTLSLLPSELEIHSYLDLPEQNWETDPVLPEFRFLLEQMDGACRARLLVVPFPGSDDAFPPLTGPAESLRRTPDGQVVRMVRSPDAERGLLESFFRAYPRLDTPEGRETCRWQRLPLEDVCEITADFPALGDRFVLGWLGPSRRRDIRNVDFSQLRLKATGGERWLDIAGQVVVDPRTVLSFRRLLSLAGRQRGRFITLDDGAVIRLSERLRRQLDLLNNIGAAQKDGVRLGEYLYPVFQEELQELLDSRLIPGRWLELVQRVRAAEGLDPVLPGGLSPDLVLRDYQVEGFKWLARLDAWHAGACLADDMGLGKTLQAIAFLVAKQDEGPALVVAPTSVCANWLDEIHRFAPTLETVRFENGQRSELLDRLTARQVLVTSYGLFQRERENIERIAWRTAVLDEAQAIKNSHAKRSQAARRIQADFRLVTTGTPIENNLGELWSIFQFLLPGLLGSEEHFRDRFVVPIEVMKDSVAATHLNALVRPFILRRRKGEVLKQLPPKTEIGLAVEQSPREQAFYEAIRQEAVEKLRNTRKAAGELRFNILAALTRLRQAACNPRLIEGAPEDLPCAKMDALLELLEGLLANRHHVLVFSQFVRHLELVREQLPRLGCTWSWLTGESTVPERQQAIDDFQNGANDVFLISLKAGGVGLNLTQADFVVILDPWWNPAVEDQAADRAHRIGQTRPVTIYRLITRNTIEEKILRLHAEKKDLAEQILQQTETSRPISPEELMRLLTED